MMTGEATVTSGVEGQRKELMSLKARVRDPSVVLAKSTASNCQATLAPADKEPRKCSLCVADAPTM